MDAARHERIVDIFVRAKALPSEQRRGLIDEACAEDLGLRAEIESLLAADEREVSFLDAPREGGVVAVIAGHDDDALIGTRVGPYELRRLVATGGMGVVYEAMQQHPHRIVALKLMRHGFSSASTLRRFQLEAEMLGRLQHVGIAQVYDAGIHKSPTGMQIPYFAMELIHGTALTEYAQQQRLGTRDRLALLASVCDAVEHAHQKGVIHRDLKPANVLVDAGGQPKVLDFGIARVTDADLGTTTMPTSVGQLLGTLPYMSPEQTSGNPADLDTRSDVYSLGVILYELLTDRLPYDLSQHSIAGAVRVIQETEPIRLSSINRVLRGDLETLAAKALEKDKEHRYGSAAALAADILRYLMDLPLSARPASTFYQPRKFAKRNRGLVAAASLCLLLLVGGVTGTTMGWVSSNRANRKLAEAVVEATTQRDRARDSEAKATTEEAKATTELARSQEIAEFMRSMLQSVNPAVARERDTTLLREILERAVKKIESGELSDQSVVEAEMRSTISETYASIGDNAAALRVIEPAIQMARAAPVDQAASFLHARILYATTLVVWGRYADARAEFEQAVAIHQGAGLPEDEQAGVLYSNFGGVQSHLGNAE